MSDLGGTVGEVVPYALAITISPLPIVGEILLLFSARPKVNGGAYAAGFAAGLTAVVSVFVVLAGGADLASSQDGVGKGMAGVQLALGVLCFLGAARRLRPSDPPEVDPATGEPPLPRWMARLEGSSAGGAATIGALIGALNPKNIAVGIPAAVAIAGAGLGGGQQAAAIGVFVVIAFAGVAVPLVVAVALGERSTAILQSWRTWLLHNNARVMGVLLAVIGVILLINGVSGLT